MGPRADEEDELDAWMARLADGDRAAFEPLFRALHPRAIRLARSKLGDDLAADAAQSALLKVFARASAFEPGRPLLPWFYVLAGNEITSLSRARNKTATRAAPLEVASELANDDDPEAELLERELASALDAAIQSLDAPSAEAIACLLGQTTKPDISAMALRKRLSRAYARLRILLGGIDGS